MNKSERSGQPASSNSLYDQYKDALAQVQTKVLAAHDPLKTKVKRWDEQFFLTHNRREPQLADYKKDNEAYKDYKKLHLCKELLRHWKITVHLE